MFSHLLDFDIFSSQMASQDVPLTDKKNSSFSYNSQIVLSSQLPSFCRRSCVIIIYIRDPLKRWKILIKNFIKLPEKVVLKLAFTFSHSISFLTAHLTTSCIYHFLGVVIVLPSCFPLCHLCVVVIESFKLNFV